MKAWKTAALAAAFVAAAGIGAALAPVAHGQKLYTASPKKAGVQDWQIFTGGGRLGVSVRDVTDDDVKKNRLPASGGVVVEDVSEESAAAKAGFKTGDVILEFDGERVRSVRQFTRLVQETASGRAVTASVIRDGQKQSLSVTPGEGDAFTTLRGLEMFRNNRDGFAFALPRPPTPPRPPNPPSARAPLLRDFDGFVFRSGTTLGVTVNPLSGQLADYFGVKDGLLVTAVTADSPAAKAGVKAGDVITSVNGKAVNDVGDIRNAMQDVKDGGEFTVEVVRDRRPMTLKGKTEERPTPRRRVVV